jgi:spermidine synthase
MRTLGLNRILAAAVMLAMTAAARAQPQGIIIAEVPSQYQKITVFDTLDNFRWMIFDAKFDGRDPIQSEMNKSQPLALTMAYAQHMVASLALVEKPKRILIVGLGGGCLQRYLHELLPETRIDSAELDPAVLSVAKKFFNFKEDDRQHVSIGDGRKFIEDSKDKYDVIMLDAFSATSIPYLLSTKEFLEVTKARLADGGIVSANLWEAHPDYGSLLKTYNEVFPEWHVVRCAQSTNAILTAFPAKRDLTVEKWITAAAAFDKTYKSGLNLPQLLDHGFVATPRIPSDAKVLLDKDEPKAK